MDALINAQPHQGGEPIDSPLRSGLTSHANPEAQSVATGVSVESTHSATGETSTPKITPPPIRLEMVRASRLLRTLHQGRAAA